MFHHSALPIGSFRLLKLQPNLDKITISITIFPLSDSIPDYEALSYAWGSGEPTSQIHCLSTDPVETHEENSDTVFAVSEHLEEALRCLRAKAEVGKPRWLWIDAICIDQKSPEEKSYQVPLMSDIYSRARAVIIWLGKLEVGTENVMKQIPELAEKLSHVKDLQSVNFRTASSFGLPPGTDPIWTRLAHWYDNEYFSRLWVLQEACLAREAFFLCGTERLAFQDASNLAVLLQQTQIVGASSQSNGVPPGLTFLDSLLDAKDILSDGYDIGLLVFINMTRSLLCRDIVDRVYGILGMLHEETRRKIPVVHSQDLNDNPSTLFTHVAKVLLEETGPMNRFGLFWFMSRQRMLHTPSWVPGYMYPIDGQALFLERAGWPEDPDSPYREAQIFTSLSEPLASLLHPDNIQVRGMAVDEIVDVVHLDWTWSYLRIRAEMNPAIEAENASQFLRIEAACADLAKKADIEVPSEAYCQVLVANRDIQGIGPYNLHDICDDYRETLLMFKKAQGGIIEEGLRPNRPRLYRFVTSMSEKWRTGRSFFLTKGGRIGIGGLNHQVRSGDQLCIFFGAHQLFILRSLETPGLFTMVGDAYVRGFMNAEAFGQKGPEIHGQIFEIC